MITTFVAALTCALASPKPARADAAQLAEQYAAAIQRVNEDHARKPVANDEAELARKLPAAASQWIDALAHAPDSAATRTALARAADAALDLDRLADFETLRARLAELSPEDARSLGIALSRPRFVVRGRNGFAPEGLRALADVFDLVLDGYAELFGLVNFTKLPGKKLRLVAHLEPQITAPPHFAPEPPWHSEIDFPLVDAAKFSSPTADGKMLLYGLCHELGHVLAMWGDPRTEEDHHAWAHYTGLALVDHLAREHASEPALKDAHDVRWRSLELERKTLAESKTKAGVKDKDAVLALFAALHELVGPKTIGEALAALDAANECQRVNRVRYFRFEAFERALLATKAGKRERKAIELLFAGK